MRTFVLALASLALSAPVQAIPIQEHGAAKWACGGAGVEERETLASIRSASSLELLFVTEKRGGYLADVAVKLERADGTAPALRFVSDGPICMMTVPAGAYRIEASFAGATRTQRVAVSSATGKAARVVFQFPGEPWDGIWASDEEKRSARAQ
jgi:hypothetical protein